MGTALPLQPRVKPQPLLLTLLPRTLSLVIPKANGVKKLFATWLKRLATQPAAIFTRGDLTHKGSVGSPAKNEAGRSTVDVLANAGSQSS